MANTIHSKRMANAMATGHLRCHDGKMAPTQPNPNNPMAKVIIMYHL